MRDKKVKIIATLGPATNTYESIHALAQEGVDVFRINFSHSTHDDAKELVANIRKAEQELHIPLAIMGDLAGPKIRIDEMEKGTILQHGHELEIVSEHIKGTSERFSLNHSSIIQKLQKDAVIYIDDGNIRLIVTEKMEDKVKARVDVGGPLVSYKGFSAEGIALDSASLSEKDKRDIDFITQSDFDAIAVSFVQTEEDMHSVRNELPEHSRIMLIAKIETEGGVERAEQILEASDGLMVARGDLGLAVPLAKIPHIQKKLIELCTQKAKPVITATQMLESMISRPIPTRAEVTDVANAILDGTDAVMLSGETSLGKNPLDTVKIMVKIIHEALKSVREFEYKEASDIGNAVSAAVGKISEQINAKLIIAFTQSGITARRISRHKPHQVILALSPDLSTIRHLNFSWGVYPIHIQPTSSFDHFMEQAKEYARSNDICKLETDEPFVIAAGMPFGESGTTNLILIERT